MHRSLSLLFFFIMLSSTITVAASSPNFQLESEGNRGSFEPAECWFDSPIPLLMRSDFECGYVTVPEFHSDSDGRTIRIPVAILRSKVENPAPDPLFMAQGGPGGDAFEVFPILTGQKAEKLGRDIVIFNQRGTRYAEPNLMCTESFEAAQEILMLSGDEADNRAVEALSACYERLLDEGTNPSAYNSLENAADVDVIREALGYDEYNFYGVSYGTLLGLHLMRNHPDQLRSVILDGVVPPDLNFIPQVARNTDRVFTEIIQTCENDAECRAEFPDLENRFFALVDELNQSPKTLTIRDPETGERVETLLNGDALVELLFQAFYLPDAYATFPKLVANLEEGDYTFIRGIWPLIALDRTLSEGMYFSVICAEDADFYPDEVMVEGIRPYFADGAVSEMQSYLDVCEIWQVNQLPAEVDNAVQSDIPTLLLSGHYDPITPPNFASVAAEGLDNGYTFVDPTGSHGVALADSCLDGIVQQFLESPEREPDGSCLEEIEPTDFVAADAISFPFLGEINQFSPSMWTQLGFASLFLIGILSSYLVLPVAWLIGVLRKKDHLARTYDPKARRLKWIGGILALLFGMLALIFVSGVAFFTIQSLLNGMANIFAISRSAVPFFVIPLILILISLGLSIIAVSSWRKKVWPLWAKIYYSFLAICAVGYVIVLTMGGMTTMLL